MSKTPSVHRLFQRPQPPQPAALPDALYVTILARLARIEGKLDLVGALVPRVVYE